MDQQLAQSSQPTGDQYTHKEYLLAYYLNIAQKLISGAVSKEQFAEELTQIHLSLERKVYQDGLVETFLNNIGFTNALERELKLIKRANLSGTLLALDIDHLKKFNDSMGHIKGDKLIKTYAQIISQHIRQSDLKGRLGGDEFAVFLIGSSGADAKIVAERVRVDIIEAVRTNFPNLPWEQTISIGIAEFLHSDDTQSLRARADGALYEAKKERNKVVVAS